MGGLVKWLQTQSIISLFPLSEKTSFWKTVRNVGHYLYYLKFWRAVGVKGWKNSNDIWKVDENYDIMIAPWVGWSTGHPIVSACLFPPQHPDVYLTEGGSGLRYSIVYYSEQMVDYGSLLSV